MRPPDGILLREKLRQQNTLYSCRGGHIQVLVSCDAARGLTVRARVRVGERPSSARQHDVC